jgi:NAD(P)-dependent dehydrogenase (short-subunit alcohol dehydrogenase family)
VSARAGRVEGKVAIVTGAGSTPGPGVGTGKASAIHLAREGARVVLVDIAPDRAEETRARIEADGGEALVIGADATSSSDCEAVVRAALDRWGSLDILVNNVGRAAVGTVVDISEEDWDRSLDLNLRTTFLMCKHAVPAMVAAGGGSIVNMCSISAVRGDGTAAYSAAKGAMLALTIDMAYSHGRDGIRVNAIAPGHITTPMVHSVQQPGPHADFMDAMRREAGLLGTAGDGWDVAHGVTFLASDEARWITGVLLPVDAGVLSVTPLLMAGHLRGVPAPE